MTLVLTVAGHELRKSLVRRQPVACLAVWAFVVICLTFMAAKLPSLNGGLFTAFPTIMLPLLTPAFAAGAFAKEHEQHTWQDLMLTSLRPRDLLFGKFLACYLGVVVVLSTLALPVVLGLIRSSYHWDPINYYQGRYYGEQIIFYSQVPSLAVVLAMKCALHAVFYVSMALVCSHYCSKARQALAVSYSALLGYSLVAYMLVTSVERWRFRYYSSQFYYSSTELRFADQLHLATCLILTGGAWALLSVALKFRRG